MDDLHSINMFLFLYFRTVNVLTWSLPNDQLFTRTFWRDASCVCPFNIYKISCPGENKYKKQQKRMKMSYDLHG